MLAADQAHLREAIESVRWMRRGPLQRLVRIRRDERDPPPEPR